MLINELDKEITQSDLEALETFADRIFGKVGIDVEFTRHFLDRVNDERNGKQITASELTRLFKQEYKKWGKPIAQMGPDAEAVMKDLATDINMPFVLSWDSKNKELDLVAKTVMRKPNFKTSNREFPVESEGDHNRAYKVVHVKFDPVDIMAKTTHEAALKAAVKWGLKSTSGIDVHLYPKQVQEKNPHRDGNALSSEENRDINKQRQNQQNKKAALVNKFAQIEKGRHAVAVADPIDYKMNADNSATMPYTPYKSKAANYAANVRPEYYFKEEQLNEWIQIPLWAVATAVRVGGPTLIKLAKFGWKKIIKPGAVNTTKVIVQNPVKAAAAYGVYDVLTDVGEYVKEIKDMVGDAIDDLSIQSLAELAWKNKLPLAAVAAVLYGGSKLKAYMKDNPEDEKGDTTINNYYYGSSEPATEGLEEQETLIPYVSMDWGLWKAAHRGRISFDERLSQYIDNAGGQASEGHMNMWSRFKKNHGIKNMSTDVREESFLYQKMKSMKKWEYPKLEEALNEFTISDLKYMGITHITPEQKKELQKISHENSGNITRSDLKKLGLLLQTRHVREEDAGLYYDNVKKKDYSHYKGIQIYELRQGLKSIRQTLLNLQDIDPKDGSSDMQNDIKSMLRGYDELTTAMVKAENKLLNEGSFWGSDDMVKKVHDEEKARGMIRLRRTDDDGTHGVLVGPDKVRFYQDRGYQIVEGNIQVKGSDPMPKAKPGRTDHPFRGKLVGSKYDEEVVNEESGIWKFNKEDPNNPEVLIQGFGRLMLNQIEDDLVGKFESLADMAKNKDWETIDSRLKSTIVQTKLEAILNSKEQLQSIRRKGGPKSRGIVKESRISLYDALIGEDKMGEGMFDKLKVSSHKKAYVRAADRLHEMLQRKYEENDGNWRHALNWYVAKIADGFTHVDSKILHDFYLENYKSAFITETGGVGKVVPGVNTSIDVGPNEIKTQAAKFGNIVDKDGLPKKTFR